MTSGPDGRGPMDLKRGISQKVHFFLNALKKFDTDHGFLLSSGITFNLLICLVPLTLLLLGLVGTYLYSDREVLSHIRRYLESVAPSLDPRIMRNILRVIQGRKIVGILGIGGLIWSSTWVFSSLRTALNIVFQIEKGRGILRGKAIDLLMIFIAGLFHIASMTLTSVFTVIKKYRFSPAIDLGPVLQWMLKYAVPFFFTFGMFFLIYKIIPDRKIHFKSALQAALFTSLFWEVAKQLFGWYVLHLGKFSMVYGSLGTLAIFFLWVYYSSVILLLGGEVAFLLEKREDGVNGWGEEKKDEDRLYYRAGE
jgi:membrane protein